METIVVSHVSAIRAIRDARWKYSALLWDRLSKVEARRALRACVPNKGAIDFEALERMGIFSDEENEVHVLVSRSSARRAVPGVVCHTIAKTLPRDAIRRIGENVYCTSPAFSALLYARGRSLGQVVSLLMELLGTYSLPPESTVPIAHGEYPNSREANERPRMARYKCEPATTLKELIKVASWTASSVDVTFRQAVKLVEPGSASPGETLVYGMLALPMRCGGLGCRTLKGRRVRLNYKIDFTDDAVHISSGMPYAISDFYVPAAKTDVEYNGFGHEEHDARIHDGNRNNGLRAMGIKIIVIYRGQMQDIQALEAVARTLHRDAGVRFRYRVEGYRELQGRLLNELRAAIGLPPA